MLNLLKKKQQLENDNHTVMRLPTSRRKRQHPYTIWIKNRNNKDTGHFLCCISGN